MKQYCHLVMVAMLLTVSAAQFELFLHQLMQRPCTPDIVPGATGRANRYRVSRLGLMAGLDIPDFYTPDMPDWYATHMMFAQQRGCRCVYALDMETILHTKFMGFSLYDSRQCYPGQSCRCRSVSKTPTTSARTSTTRLSGVSG